jgi:hypothetical protein
MRPRFRQDAPTQLLPNAPDVTRADIRVGAAK